APVETVVPVETVAPVEIVTPVQPVEEVISTPAEVIPEPIATPVPEITTTEIENKEIVQEMPKIEKTSSKVGPYIGIALTEMGVSLNDEVNLFEDKFNQDRQDSITLVAGYNFMEYLGAELRASLAVAGDDYHNDKLREYGIYLKPQYDILQSPSNIGSLNIYGLLGYSSINLSDPSLIRFTGTNQGFSFGGGFDYGITENISVFTDYVNYLHDKSGSNSTWGANLGIKYNF
ncbi:MAG: outer membrane beta-barrel protein, partial [Sulfurovaceae bacterium]|nr:outer membrane beta-barrel protein [Sulfurovaceae bacterium]